MGKKAMTTRKKRQRMAKSTIGRLVFGPAPILKGEDADAYNELLAGVSSRVKPSDVIEEIYVRDFVDLTWEIVRHRRHKASFIEAAVPRALEEALEPIVNRTIEACGVDWLKIEVRVGLKPTPTQRLVSAWIVRDRDAVKDVNKMLNGAELTMEDINARAMALAMDDLIQLDRLSLRAEVSRSAALAELERWRFGFAERLRNAAQDTVDGEFEEVGPKAVTHQGAAE